MITCKLFILCEQSIVDQFTQELSLIGIKDDLTPLTTFPIPFPSVSLVLWTERTDDIPADIDFEIKAEIEDQEVFRRPFRVNFEDKPKNRLLVKLQGLLIPRDGILEFSVTYEGEMVATTEILIHPFEGSDDVVKSIEQG